MSFSLPEQVEGWATVSGRGVSAGQQASYCVPRWGSHVDLRLDANEGPAHGLNLPELTARIGPDGLRRYPDASAFEAILANALDVPAARLLVTAGGDDAIDRACRAFLAPGREIILPLPTFEMIGRYAQLAGATIIAAPWPEGPYPLRHVIERISAVTAMVAVVSPNNPTGAVATAGDLVQLSRAAPNAVLLVDLAYTEFADVDLTHAALQLPNTVVIRTFSKAFGLAGLRIGYAVGSPERVQSMRAAGSPYPVSKVSMACAEAALAGSSAFMQATVSQVRREREWLAGMLQQLGARPLPSQANFVLAEFGDAVWVWRALSSLGIATRRFAGSTELARSLRITCPGDDAAFARLVHALDAALRPQALLFDLDGVIADVGRSYRRAIELTADSFGVRISPSDIELAKAEGNANNDWILTARLLASRGVSADLPEVTRRFEALYHGTGSMSGLASLETLIPDRSLLQQLAGKFPLAIVTGRPRRDCQQFLQRFDLAAYFDTVVCMEDAEAKPSPQPTQLALDRLGVDAAWMVGDTPDDIVSARAAGVVPLGIVPPGATSEVAARALDRAGAARVLASLSDLLEMLP